MCVSADDVAAYILKKCGGMTTMKLQKLVYYCQAWSLVWDEKPLFKEKIEAWASGPVVRKLYHKHKGMFTVKKWSDGDISKFTKDQRQTMDAVIKFYCDKTSQWLSDLTHNEEPWKKARKGLSPSDRGNNVITLSSMMEYYSSLEE
ncbi:MAG: Panacea domain-containing protein [Syntrophales bacterium]